MFQASHVRQDFPQLKRKIRGKPIVYLDSTATSLKPQAVIKKINDYYTKYTANVFRGIYQTSEEATAQHEEARAKVAKFIGAPTPDEIVFTRNTTESINLVAYGWGRDALRPGDNVVATVMEHHSNFVPWQQFSQQQGFEFRIWDIEENYELDTKQLERLVDKKTKLLAVTAASNVLGTLPDIAAIVKAVKRLNPHCLVLVDAAQAVPHMPVDVGSWGCDFVAFSSHKMLGPTGIGVLWAKMEHLSAMQPFNYGGEMIAEVYRDRTLFKPPPHKFEAGTPHIAGVIGLGAAVDYLTELGMENVRKHEKEIVIYALKELSKVKGLRMYGPALAEERGGVVAFTMDVAHAHDVAQILDEDAVCVRAGNHCAMPLHLHLGLASTARASFYIYTTKGDVDTLIAGLEKVRKVFG
jgi:cysteine desulfurase/selenocysteine lyase